MNIKFVVLCGGSGTRLWPQSREKYPKQFLMVDGDFSLLQFTLLRLLKINSDFIPILIVGEDCRFLIAE